MTTCLLVFRHTVQCDQSVARKEHILSARSVRVCLYACRGHVISVFYIMLLNSGRFHTHKSESTNRDMYWIM